MSNLIEGIMFHFGWVSRAKFIEVEQQAERAMKGWNDALIINRDAISVNNDALELISRKLISPTSKGAQ